MEKKIKNIHPDQWLKDLPLQTEPEGFKPEEMLKCEKCDRNSPPTRVNCFYCGGELPVSDLQNKHLRLNLRKLESWEKGFNLIYSPNLVVDNAKIPEIAKLIDFEPEELEKLLSLKKSLPIARLELWAEVDILDNRLKDYGFTNSIISDESLQMETITRRLRGIEFFKDKLILIRFNNDEIVEVLLDEIVLIVTGAVNERKIEAVESMKRKEKNKILDSSEISSDEMLIDIYTKNDSIGFRIQLTGFDFSCLGTEKGFLAKDNILKLLSKLREIAPNAKFDEDYLQICGSLGKVWEVDERSDSSGVDKKLMGTIQRKNITTISNLSQFTRYSRLQWQLL